jgi:hypothetical protein
MELGQHRREVEAYDGNGKPVGRIVVELLATGDPNVPPSDEAFERAGLAKAREDGKIKANDAKASAKVVDYLGGYNAHHEAE